MASKQKRGLYKRIKDEEQFDNFRHHENAT
jgi:hypothetical protein